MIKSTEFVLDPNICANIIELQNKYFPKMINLNKSNESTKNEFKEFGGCYLLKKNQSKYIIMIGGQLN